MIDRHSSFHWPIIFPVHILLHEELLTTIVYLCEALKTTIVSKNHFTLRIKIQKTLHFSYIIILQFLLKMCSKLTFIFNTYHPSFCLKTNFTTPSTYSPNSRKPSYYSTTSSLPPSLPLTGRR